MLKTILSRALSKRKTAILAVMVLGILALTAVAAVAQTYTTSKKASLKLNKANLVATAATVLASNAVGPALTLRTDSTDPNATPLSLETNNSSQAPMQVDSEQKVNNLNADKIDDLTSADLQRRVSQQCLVGSSIRAIDANGVVTCETDDDLSGDAAGGDLSGTYPNPQIAQNAVSGSEIANGTVNSDDLADNSVSGGATGEIVNESVTADDVATNGVGSAEVADGGLNLPDVAEIHVQVLLNPSQVNGGSCSGISVSNQAVDLGDLVIVNPPISLPSGLVVFPIKGESGNIVFRLCNITGSSIDASQDTWRIAVFDDGDNI